MDLSLYIEHQEWILSETEVKRVDEMYYEPAPTWYTIINYKFKLTRKSGPYINFILVPTFLLSLLMFSVFWINPSRPDRVSVAMGIMYGYMLLLLLVVSISPPTTGIKLGTYYSTNITLVVISIVTSSISVACASREMPMNRIMRKIIIEKIGVSMGVFRQYDHIMRFNLVAVYSQGNTVLLNAQRFKHNRTKAIDLDTVEPAQRRRMECRRDWQITAAVIDRFLFVGFAIATFACIGFYFPMATE